MSEVVVWDGSLSTISLLILSRLYPDLSYAVSQLFKSCLEIQSHLEIYRLENQQSGDVKIVSSIHSPYVLRNTVKRIIEGASNSLLIAGPYYDRYFFGLLGDYARKGLDIGLIVGTYRDYQIKDWVIDAVNYFEGLSQNMRWEIYGPFCTPQLHYKMLIGQNVGLCGSLNYTGTAMNYNLEIGILVRGPQVEVLRDIYQRTVRLPRTIEWNKLKDYHGYPPKKTIKFEIERIRKRILEVYESNLHCPIHKANLKNYIVRLGFPEHLVIGTIKEMLRQNELYSPNSNDFVRPV